MGLVPRASFLVICGYNLSKNEHPRTRSPPTDYTELYKHWVGFTIKALFIKGIIRFFVFAEQLGGCGDVRGCIRDTKVEISPHL
jgi:hypothetical protein